MGQHCKESDWKLFRTELTLWRERYLEQMNKELVRILSNSKKTPSECFWAAEEKIQGEAKILRRCLDGASRSRMVQMMVQMFHSRLISEEDLEPFSDELKAQILKWISP